MEECVHDGDDLIQRMSKVQAALAEVVYETKADGLWRRQKRPYDRDLENFKRRLSSYVDAKWATTVLPLSPLVMAKHGWLRSADGMLTCEQCGNELPLQLVATGRWFGTKGFVGAASSIYNLHGSQCAFAKSATDVSMYGPSLSCSSHVYEEFQRRLDSYKVIENDLSKIRLTPLEKMFSNDSHLASALDDLASYSSGFSENLILSALFGWSVARKSDVAFLTCEYCLRLINPVIFMQKSGGLEFNPISEHRWWCPWLEPLPRAETEMSNSFANAEENSIPYWQQLVEAMSVMHHHKTHPPDVCFVMLQVMNRLIGVGRNPALVNVPCRGHARIPHWEYHIRFSPEDGRKVPSQDVLDRFKRLRTGMWIRTKPGRYVRRYMQSEPWLTSSLQHVTCTPLECQILDKLVSRFWLKPRYYVDDPYEPYNVRHGIAGCQENSAWMLPRARAKVLLDATTERRFF